MNNRSSLLEILREQLLRLVDEEDKYFRQRDVDIAWDFIDKHFIPCETAEYHQHMMMKYKASLPGPFDTILQGTHPGDVIRMYEYHKSMYEQLKDKAS